MGDDFSIGLSLPPEYQRNDLDYPPSASVQRDSSPWTQAENESPFLNNGYIGSSVNLNTNHARAWYGNFAFDIFRVGGEDVVGAVFSARDPLYKLNVPYFDLELDGSMAGYDIFPETGDFKKRNILGVAASTNLLMGSKQRLGPFVFGQMIESGASIYWGDNLSAILHFPIDVGVSAGLHAGGASFTLFGIMENYLTLGDVQDASSIIPFFNNVDVGFSARTSNLDIELGAEFFQYGAKFLYANAVVPYVPEWMPGCFNFIMGGRYPVEGGTPDNWVHEEGNFYVGMGYDFGSRDVNGTSYGVSARTYIASKSNGSAYSDALGYGAPVSAIDGPFIGDSINCGINAAAAGGNCSIDGNIDYACYASGDSVKCYSMDNSSAVSSFKAITTDGSINWNPYSSVAYHNFTVTDVNYSDSLLNMVKEHGDLDSLIADINSQKMGYPQRIQLLRQLTSMAYETYDHQAPVVPDGLGQTNSASFDEIYKQSKKTMFSHGSTPTTVCRGFAKYTAYIASQLGFESHAVSVQTQKSGHVITILREMGTGGTYYVINYGHDTTPNISSRNLTEVVREYCKLKGYSPQMVNWIFSPDGKPETIIETPLFEALEDAATVHDRGRYYLRRP